MTDSERIARLETRFEERWDAHDRRSEERLDEIKTSISRIELRLDQQKCYEHLTLLNRHDNWISAVTKFLWIFISVSIAAFVKAFWRN